MRFRTGLASLLIAGSAGGLGVAVVPAAQAVTVYGICTGGTCAKQAGGSFEAWNRDISGDSGQQMLRTYVGQVSSSQCWPFTCGNGDNAAFNGASVWRIYNINTGKCMAPYDGASDPNVYAADCNSNGVNWVWWGTGGSANLIDVYQTNLHGGSSRLLNSVGTGFVLQTPNAGANQHWGLIQGS